MQFTLHVRKQVRERERQREREQGSQHIHTEPRILDFRVTFAHPLLMSNCYLSSGEKY
jgi:hypothetical protein